MNDIDHSDVVIAGGGAAGVAAAVAASGKGIKVVLIEKNSFLGGKATGAQVGTVCGLYKFSNNAIPEYIVNGFTKNFAEALRKRSHTAPLSGSNGLHFLPYDVETFKNICMELLMANKVTVHFNSMVSTVEIRNERIEAVGIQSGTLKRRINLTTIIDCSGESIVSRLAGLPLISSDKYQAAAQVFTLQNTGKVTEASLGMILKRALQKAIDEKMLEDHFDRVYIVPGSVKNNCVSLKIGIPLNVTHTEGNLTELKNSAHYCIRALAGYLVRYVPAFKHAVISGIAPDVGVRVGQRSTGKYILTEEDVLNGNKTGDAIANGSWPIEEWDLNKRVKMRYFRPDDFYQVPSGCLLSDTVQNLLMAGRNISATDGAIASARVIGTCLQTGYAAGLLAAGMVVNISEKEIIKIIQTGQL